MNKVLLTFCLLMLTHIMYAQNAREIVNEDFRLYAANIKAKEIAKSLGENFRLWSVTQSETYRTNIEKMCDGKKSTRVADEIAIDLALKNNNPSINSYELESYLNWLDLRIDEISIVFSDFELVDKNKINISNIKDKKMDKELTYVSCKVQISGAFSYNVKDLIYIRDGKISKIDKYVVDKNNKVHVDFSDLVSDYETIGFTYNYGQHFPVGASFNYTPEDVHFMLSVDLGVNLDNDKHIIDKVEMTDIMNYKRETKVLDPKFFLTVTPQFYMKYFAIGCGVGVLYMDGTEETASYTNSSSGSSGSSVSISTSSSSGTSSSTNTSMFKPMIRPVVKGFIPLSDELYISVSVGYDYVFGYKDKNGFNVGLGLQWEL